MSTRCDGRYGVWSGSGKHALLGLVGRAVVERAALACNGHACVQHLIEHPDVAQAALACSKALQPGASESRVSRCAVAQFASARHHADLKEQRAVTGSGVLLWRAARTHTGMVHQSWHLAAWQHGIDRIPAFGRQCYAAVVSALVVFDVRNFRLSSSASGPLSRPEDESEELDAADLGFHSPVCYSIRGLQLLGVCVDRDSRPALHATVCQALLICVRSRSGASRFAHLQLRRLGSLGSRDQMLLAL